MTITRTRPRISLSAGAKKTNLTPQGLLKILVRTDSAIREDGRWYADPSIIDQIATARRVLGIEKSRQGDKRLNRIAKRPVAASPPFELKKPVRAVSKRERRSAGLGGQSCRDNSGTAAGDEDRRLQPPPALSEIRK